MGGAAAGRSCEGGLGMSMTNVNDSRIMWRWPGQDGAPASWPLTLKLQKKSGGYVTPLPPPPLRTPMDVASF